MTMDSLRELFEHELKDIYYAEKALVKALPKMAKAASSDKLKEGIEEHLEQTKGQVERLEQVFELLGVPARGKKCEAMEGLIAEGASLIEEDIEPEVLDAGIIAAAQKVEHYEIASYGTLCTWARQLGLEDAADLLGETLEEEKQTDLKLTELAESEVNVAAEAEGE
ncbi:MAG: ferritin-like domain-containing protein [Planctomycetaceae bacterium]|nr:ferritin-like domain-containing protein [Planctomycetaceae bacterium]